MASAAAYNLLVIDDIDQDKILYNSSKLKETIALSKYRNGIKLNAELKDINSQIENINNIINSIKSTITEDNYQESNEEIEQLEATVLKLKDIYNNKYANKENIINPSVEDLKQSHSVFLNSQFKPWIESTFEYSRAVVNVKPQFGESVEFTVPTYGNFLSDMALHLRIDKLTPVQPEDKVRYANMLGHRIIKSVKLVINNNVIDEYNGEFYNVYYESYLSKDKKTAWLKCIGQETYIEGEIIADPENSDYRETKKIYNGFQTLKGEQPEVELFIPLLFWFNINRKCALLNNFEEGAVKIVISLNPISKFITCLDTVNEIYNERFNTPVISECELYTNHIFVSQEIQDIFTARSGFNLIRVHKFGEVLLDKSKGHVSLMNYIKHPSEEIIIYGRPLDNEEGIDNLNTWNNNSRLSINYIKAPIVFREDNGGFSIGINNVKIYESYDVFQNIELSFDGTTSYGMDHPNFFSSYLPLVNKNTTTKKGDMYCFYYNFFPREYEPSGYANLSKSKKIQFYYESDSFPFLEKKIIKLYVHSKAINFLVFNNTSAVLNFY